MHATLRIITVIGLFDFFYVSAQIEDQTLTGDFECESAGAYTLCQNLWGKSSGSGNQTTTLIQDIGNRVAWSTEYSWSGEPYSVKSYPYVEHRTARGMQLSDIESMPTVWTWQYESQSADLRADIAYDLWLGTPPSGNPASQESSYEIMIWLSGIGGAWPIGDRVATDIRLGGQTWGLFSGPNSNWHVFSFVAQNTNVTNFNADLKEFFDYLVANNGVSSSQYVHSLQAGTEPFIGSAVLVTTTYSIGVTTNEEAATETPDPPAPSSSSAPTASVSVSGSKSHETPAPTHTTSSRPPPAATVSAQRAHHCAIRKRGSGVLAAKRGLPTSSANQRHSHHRQGGIRPFKAALSWLWSWTR